MLPDTHPATVGLLQREALEGPGYPEDGAELDAMDSNMSTSADQYETYEEDEDQLYMQQAPNDTLIALQLLRSQFPSKARVGIFPIPCWCMHCPLWAIPVQQANIPLRVQEVVQPFMLRSQIYSLVDDRTLVDRELDDLRCAFAYILAVTN